VTEVDRTVVEQSLHIDARPETVWRYWTDPDRLCDWWGAAAEVDPQPGGRCVVEMENGGTMRGEYLEVVPHERIVLAFGWDPGDGAPDIAPGSTRVEITLTPDGDGTLLELRHSGLPTAVRDMHDAGWSHFLPLLASAVTAAST
jgi:uncharacterized protein YndB with AHSA1/START domain